MTILRVVMSFFACAGFAIVLNAPRKELFYCGLCGLISFVVYMALYDVVGSIFAIFAATIVSMGFARICSYRRKSPSTMYVIMGILPHVPGAGMYYTMYGILNSDMVFSYMKGVETFKTAGVIAMGVIIVFLLPAKLFTIGIKKEN